MDEKSTSPEYTSTQVCRYAGTQVGRCRQTAVLKLGDETSDFIHPNKLGSGPWAHRAKSDLAPALEENLMASGDRDTGLDKHSTDVKGSTVQTACRAQITSTQESGKALQKRRHFS